VRVEIVQFLFKLLLKQRIIAVHHDFHWLLLATKLLTAKPHSRYVEELELVSEPEIWKGRKIFEARSRRWDRTFTSDQWRK